MRSSVCKDAILICFGRRPSWLEADAKAVLRLMMTDTAPQIEAVSRATTTHTHTHFHLGEIERHNCRNLLLLQREEEEEDEGIWIWI